MSGFEPIGHVQFLCPECGAKLLVEQLGDEPDTEDRVLCPVHGFIGNRDEVTRQAIEQNRDKITQEVAEHIKDALRKAFR